MGSIPYLSRVVLSGMPKPPEETSIRKAAAIAGVKWDTVKRWVKTGRLTARQKVVTITVVKVADVVELAGKIKRGRPPKGGR
jgi:hypothetical protein